MPKNRKIPLLAAESYEFSQYLILLAVAVVALLIFKAIEKLFYVSLGFNENRAAHAWLLAGLATIVFLLFIAMAQKTERRYNIPPGNLSAGATVADVADE